MSTAIEFRGVRLTSPDRVVYPGQGITKRELAEYYVAVADRILPLISDRPLTLVRCPRGQDEACFIQRRAGDSVPDAVLRVDLPRPESNDDGEESGPIVHLAIDSLDGLLGLVQIGVLEVHTWGARRDRLERPDRMTIDLDPDEGLPFAAVTEAALRVGGIVREAGLTPFVMTTGGKGLHVVVPIRRTVDWDLLKATARGMAERLEAEAPERYLAKASKSARRGRIYVDYLRNGYGATSVTAYSTRARPGAPVATPISWEELEAGVEPAAFDTTTVPSRIAGESDPWSSFRASAGTLSTPVRERLTSS